MIQNFTKTTIELNDGALCGLSDGAKMDVKSAIIEYVDNAEDEGASKVSIYYEESTKTLTVLSVEETDLEMDCYRKLFSLGVSGKLHTKKNGVGKYSQGFKYAGPHLIGEGNKGEVQVAVRPISGNNWGAVQYIDYTNDENYTDKYIEFNNGSEMPNGYNFMVKVIGCKHITDNELIKLMVELGIRYREKIVNGETEIYLNDNKIIPQDRLYSKHGCRVDYHSPIFLEWNGNKKAATWEWSDLRKTVFEDIELIQYDQTLGIQGRTKGVAISSRSCVEVAINGVTIIIDGKNEFKNLTGIDAQPSSSGFRGRLNILDCDLADTYIKGGNKSCSSVLSTFSENDDTLNIRTVIKDDYNKVVNRYKDDEPKRKLYFSISTIDEWCKNHNIDCCFKFSHDNDDVEAFRYEKNYNQIVVNTNSNIMSPFKTESAITLFIMSFLLDRTDLSIENIYKRLKNFKNLCEFNDIVK